MEWISNNYQWIFSGLGIFLISLFIYKPWSKSAVIVKRKKTESELKDVIRVLIIDDDTRFKVAEILQASGWVHTKLIKDIDSMSNSDLEKSNIIFVDVQGVGKTLGFQEEGLGLARAVKEKFPDKKVVIYSAETKGDRFHSALRDADSFLSKNADPYEFQQLVENFADDLQNEGKI